jgi:hypothetical protein
MIDRDTVIRLARQAVNSGDGSELSGDAIERFAQLVFLEAANQEPQASAQGPSELWLQLHGDCSDAELDEPVDYTSGDVTWCWHRINDSDVRYIRADLAPKDGVGRANEKTKEQK